MVFEITWNCPNFPNGINKGWIASNQSRGGGEFFSLLTEGVERSAWCLVREGQSSEKNSLSGFGIPLTTPMGCFLRLV